MRTVSQDAVIKRINRKLEAEHPGSLLQVRKTRGVRAQVDLGGFYLHNRSRNFIQDKFINLTEMAKKYNVLAATETIASAV
jgi:hypothetical protein